MSDLLQSALRLGRNKDIAKEEYMVATGKKEPAAFEVIPAQIELTADSDEMEFVLQLAVTKNGYMEIDAYCPDEFLTLSRRVLTTDVFSGGFFDLPVTVHRNKLHGGRNFSYISLSTSAQEIKVPVVVDEPVKIIFDEVNRSKQIFLELAQIYFDFRRNRMDSDDWAKQSLEIIGTVSGTDRQTLFLMLFQAQLHIELEEFVDAANLLEYMSDHLQRLPHADVALISYFAYVRALYERDKKRTEEILNWLKATYEQIPCWQTLWILFQLDPNYEGSPGLKLDDISAGYDAGWTSPVLLFEALEIFLQFPRFLSDASDYELQVLNLGRKLDYLSSALSSRLTEIFLLMTETELAGRNLKLAERILIYLYERYPTRDLLRVLCRVMIISDRDDQEAGYYYDIAVREYLDDIPNLFIYYIFSRKPGVYDPLPVRVMEYFSKGSENLFDARRYFYSNIAANKEKKPEYYRAFEEEILKFAEQQMVSGYIDDDLTVIYKTILDDGKLSHNMRVRLFEIISTKEIICHNDRMMNVMVFHDELNVYQDIPLHKGCAKVKIYSHNAVILFKDITGNIYANIDYEKKEFLNSSEYIDICVKGVPISDYMLMSDTMPLLRGYKDPGEILNFMTHRMNTASFRSGYVQKLINDTVVYFSRNLRGSDIYDELLAFFKYDLNPETKGKLIEVMIDRTLYRDAYEKIREEGFEHVSPESTAKLAGALAELVSYREDALLLEMCEYCFTKTTFEPRIFKYMVQNYEGDLEVLLELYRAGRAYGESCENLPEKILRRAIDSDEDSALIPQIFAKYYTEGPDGELKERYMTYKALRYLYYGEKKDTDFFKYIENDLMQRKTFPAPTIVAYLKYMSDQDVSGKRRIRLIEVQLKALVGRGIMLEDFKGFSRFFELPAVLSNSVILTCFGNGGKVSYDILSKDKTVHKDEAMTEIFEGCFAKYITLFYGESVVYSLNGEEPVRVSYDDLDIVNDESRYSELNNIIRMKETGNVLALNLAAKEYFVKDRLMERLF